MVLVDNAIERVTVTIDPELLRLVDGLVTGGSAKSRSHAIELLLHRGLATQRVRKAVVLAGGPRDSLFHGSTPKPLLEVNGMAVIERTLVQLKRGGVEEVAVCVGESGEKIVSLLKNGEAYGLKVSYVWEPGSQPLGGAGALRLAQPQLSEPFLVTYSDVVFPDLDVGDLYAFHRQNNALCTLCLASMDEPSDYGVARMSGSRITAFVEKPPSAEGHLVNAGVAIFEPSVFGFIPASGRYSFEKGLLPALARTNRLFGYVYSGKWFDVGRPGGLAACRAGVS